MASHSDNELILENPFRNSPRTNYQLTLNQKLRRHQQRGSQHREQEQQEQQHQHQQQQLRANSSREQSVESKARQHRSDQATWEIPIRSSSSRHSHISSSAAAREPANNACITKQLKTGNAQNPNVVQLIENRKTAGQRHSPPTAGENGGALQDAKERDSTTQKRNYNTCHEICAADGHSGEEVDACPWAYSIPCSNKASKNALYRKTRCSGGEQSTHISELASASGSQAAAHVSVVASASPTLVPAAAPAAADSPSVLSNPSDKMYAKVDTPMHKGAQNFHVHGVEDAAAATLKTVQLLNNKSRSQKKQDDNLNIKYHASNGYSNVIARIDTPMPAPEFASFEKMSRNDCGWRGRNPVRPFCMNVFVDHCIYRQQYLTKDQQHPLVLFSGEPLQQQQYLPNSAIGEEHHDQYKSLENSTRDHSLSHRAYKAVKKLSYTNAGRSRSTSLAGTREVAHRQSNSNATIFSSDGAHVVGTLAQQQQQLAKHGVRYLHPCFPRAKYTDNCVNGALQEEYSPSSYPIVPLSSATHCIPVTFYKSPSLHASPVGSTLQNECGSDASPFDDFFHTSGGVAPCSRSLEQKQTAAPFWRRIYANLWNSSSTQQQQILQKPQSKQQHPCHLAQPNQITYIYGPGSNSPTTVSDVLGWRQSAKAGIGDASPSTAPSPSSFVLRSTTSSTVGFPPNIPDRRQQQQQRWRTRSTFVLASVSAALQIGCVWRFPTYCFKFGGAAFLFAYLLLLLALGVPLLALEMALGQVFRGGQMKVMNLISPRLRGLAAATVLLSFLICVYYSVLISWSLQFIFFSLEPTLPWSIAPPEAALCAAAGNDFAACTRTSISTPHSTSLLSLPQQQHKQHMLPALETRRLQTTNPRKSRSVLKSPSPGSNSGMKAFCTWVPRTSSSQRAAEETSKAGEGVCVADEKRKARTFLYTDIVGAWTLTVASAPSSFATFSPVASTKTADALSEAPSKSATNSSAPSGETAEVSSVVSAESKVTTPASPSKTPSTAPTISAESNADSAIAPVNSSVAPASPNEKEPRTNNSFAAFSAETPAPYSAPKVEGAPLAKAKAASFAAADSAAETTTMTVSLSQHVWSIVPWAAVSLAAVWMQIFILASRKLRPVSWFTFLTVLTPVVAMFIIAGLGLMLDGASLGLHHLVFVSPDTDSAISPTAAAISGGAGKGAFDVASVSSDSGDSADGKKLPAWVAALSGKQLWIDAAAQVTLSLGLFQGIVTAYASHKKLTENVLVDAAAAAATNASLSVLAAVAAFAVAGHVAKRLNAFDRSTGAANLSALQDLKGSQLVFVLYPLAFTSLSNGWAQATSCLFFFALMVLGLTSAVGMLQPMLQFMISPGRTSTNKSNSIRWITVALTIFGLLLGLPFRMRGGLLLLEAADFHWSVLGLTFIGCCESIAFGWVYGVGRQAQRVGYLPLIIHSFSYWVAVLVAAIILFVLKPPYNLLPVAAACSLPIAAVGAFLAILFCPRKRRKQQKKKLQQLEKGDLQLQSVQKEFSVFEADRQLQYFRTASKPDSSNSFHSNSGRSSEGSSYTRERAAYMEELSRPGDSSGSHSFYSNRISSTGGSNRHSFEAFRDIGLIKTAEMKEKPQNQQQSNWKAKSHRKRRKRWYLVKKNGEGLSLKSCCFWLFLGNVEHLRVNLNAITCVGYRLLRLWPLWSGVIRYVIPTVLMMLLCQELQYEFVTSSRYQSNAGQRKQIRSSSHFESVYLYHHQENQHKGELQQLGESDSEVSKTRFFAFQAYSLAALCVIVGFVMAGLLMPNLWKKCVSHERLDLPGGESADTAIPSPMYRETYLLQRRRRAVEQEQQRQLQQNR